MLEGSGRSALPKRLKVVLNVGGVAPPTGGRFILVDWWDGIGIFTELMDCSPRSVQ
jgi:hypothetical protein